MTLHASKVAIERDGRQILSIETLCLSPGELTAVVGPNGAGKSTLLSALTGDVTPDIGHLTLNQRPLAEYSLPELARRRAAIGAPPDLAFGFTVADVVAMGWLHGRTPHNHVFHEALAAVLDANELTALSGRTYMTLSSGERQRVQYARACLQLWPIEDISGPRWLFLDEPTANMDVAHAVHLLDALHRRAQSGDGVVVVLHDLDLAARYADKVLLVCNGQLVAQGSPAEVLTSRRLSVAYGTPIHVEHHATLDRLVVIG
jgi:iron complex transport system ATP-binding protein